MPNLKQTVRGEFAERFDSPEIPMSDVDWLDSIIDRAKKEENDRVAAEIDRIIAHMREYRLNNPQGVSGVYLDQVAADMRSIAPKDTV